MRKKIKNRVYLGQRTVVDADHRGGWTQTFGGKVSFMLQKIYEVPMKSPLTGAPIAGGVGKKLRFSTSREVAGSDPYRRKFASIRHGGPRPQRCAGRGIRGVINTFGDS